jgi:hypothetical protein
MSANDFAGSWEKMLQEQREYVAGQKRESVLRAQAFCVAAVQIQRDVLKRLRWAYLEAGPLNEMADDLARASALVASAALAAYQEERIARGELPESVRGHAPGVEVVVIRRSVRKRKRRQRDEG